MQDTKNLWLAHSPVKAKIEQLNNETEFCPWSTCPHLYPEGHENFNKLFANDGHYGVFDYLYKVVGLRSNAKEDGRLDEALADFEEASFAFMNSDEEYGQFTFKPEHGGLTYYFRKFDGEPSDIFA